MDTRRPLLLHPGADPIQYQRTVLKLNYYTEIGRILNGGTLCFYLDVYITTTRAYGYIYIYYRLGASDGHQAPP